MDKIHTAPLRIVLVDWDDPLLLLSGDVSTDSTAFEIGETVMAQPPHWASHRYAIGTIVAVRIWSEFLPGETCYFAFQPDTADLIDGRMRPVNRKRPPLYALPTRGGAA